MGNRTGHSDEEAIFVGLASLLLSICCVITRVVASSAEIVRLPAGVATASISEILNSHPGRPTRRRSSLNRASDRNESKAGRSRMDGLNRASSPLFKQLIA